MDQEQRITELTRENARIRAERDALRSALRAYVYAQSRMLERWADGDGNVKRGLWQALHACEGPAREAMELPLRETFDQDWPALLKKMRGEE
jgi:hypothetical protein